MTTTRRRAILGLALLALAAPAVTGDEPARRATTIVVLRHAEKTSGETDPGLSPEGQSRARALVGVLEHAGITAIYSSQFRRTRDTVGPLSERLGVPVTVEEISRENAARYPESLAKKVLERHPGETVVIVNHSNTVPEIVEALGGGPVPPMTEAEYNHLYIVVRDAAGARTISAEFSPGAP